MKNIYENVEIEVITFCEDDVLTASCPEVQPNPVDCDWFVGPH